MKLIDQIIDSLRNEPDQWKQGEFRLKHPNSIEIWIANGPFFYHLMCPEYRNFNLADKWRLHRAIKKWRRLPITFPKGAD